MGMVKDHGIYVDNVSTIKGYYDDSLTKELQKEYLDSGRKISLVNIDCDLYESAVPVFNFIEPLLQEGVGLHMDLCVGYKGNQQKAWPEL